MNDAPSFTIGPNHTVLEDAGAQNLAGWATAISAGPPDESAQTLSFNATNDNNGLFTVQPAINPAGDLSYTLAPNQNGAASVTVFLQDGGGTANGGMDTSPSQTFSITVDPVNDAGAQNPAGSATAINLYYKVSKVETSLSPFIGESRRIKKAIRHVQKSLESRLWQDDLHLDTRRGHSVFDRERAAVRELMRLLREHYDDDDRYIRDEVSVEALAAVEDAIDDLAAVVRLLAQTALNDAAAAPVLDPKRQKQVDRGRARAQKDLDRGDWEQNSGDSDDAIKKYKTAWRHAQKALKEAAREPRERRGRSRGRSRGDDDDDDNDD